VNSQVSMPYLPADALRKGTMELRPWPRQLRLEVKYKFATCGTWASRRRFRSPRNGKTTRPTLPSSLCFSQTAVKRNLKSS